MTFHRFQGSGDIPGYRPDVNQPNRSLQDPLGYRADPALASAVNVALTLQMPLLVTGEPGTGKTQLAYRLAAEMGLGQPLRFDVKTSSQATDLFYWFDSVRQFGQSQLNALEQKPLPPARDFVHLHALGRAILNSLPPDDVSARLSPAIAHASACQSLVLIDEIDKAPRDFPNDLLNQIEERQFTIRELQQTFTANPALAPVIVITSNSEKQLPEPFLRRCVYHHIEFPQTMDAIETILGARLRALELSGKAYKELLQWFFKLRDDAELVKKPSTSELLDWLRVLHQAGLARERPISEQRPLLKACAGSLLKTQQDIERIGKQLDDAATALT